MTKLEGLKAKLKVDDRGRNPGKDRAVINARANPGAAWHCQSTTQGHHNGPGLDMMGAPGGLRCVRAENREDRHAPATGD